MKVIMSKADPSPKDRPVGDIVLPRERRPTQAEMSPILSHILHGGPCVSLNLLTLGRTVDPVDRLFSCSALNYAVIFKFPNFERDLSDYVNHYNGSMLQKRDPRPVETGLYVPWNNEEPESGGCAIYLRQKNYRHLLHENFGLSPGDDNRYLKEDLKILQLIDSVPSLDPFLLRDCFEANHIDPKPKVVTISERENQDIREILRGKIGPVVARALQSTGFSGTRTAQFLDAIWNPGMPEARLFITAFGIEEQEAAQVFSAWKGVTFYQYQFSTVAPQVRVVRDWLRSRQSMPKATMVDPATRERIDMFRRALTGKIDKVIQELRQIIDDYDTCFQGFVGGNPAAFTQFLRSVRPRYWVMGYCVSALSAVLQIFDTMNRGDDRDPLDPDRLQTLFTRMDVALSRKRDLESAT